MLDLLIAAVIGGFLDRVRGGASAVLATGPRSQIALRYTSFIGFGFGIALLLTHDPVVALVYGLLMWGAGKLFGWTAPYLSAITGDDADAREWWQRGPLENPFAALVFVNFSWAGLPAAIVAGASYLLAGTIGPAESLFYAPFALAASAIASTAVARLWPRDQVQWYLDDKFLFSRWGVMEVTRGALTYLLCALAAG